MQFPPPPPAVIAAIDAAADEYGIPSGFLQSLAWHESRYQIHKVNRTSGAVGLLQIVPRWVTLAYEPATGEHGVVARLTDPVVNARVGAWILRRIVRSWGRLHPETLREAWDDPRWVRLLAFGYGSGWSELLGVGMVVRHLEELGYEAAQITALKVYAWAERLHAVRWLYQRRRLVHALSTADGYLESAGIAAPPVSVPRPFGVLDVDAGGSRSARGWGFSLHCWGSRPRGTDCHA